MKPGQLATKTFAHYPAAARDFAIEYLALLKQLPLPICPSFVGQIRQLDTSFPAERASLQWQCDSLAKLPPERFSQLIEPFIHIHLSDEVQGIDWVHDPDTFISALTAFLWSSGQLDGFRSASVKLFAAVPPHEDASHRLTLIVLGKGANAYTEPVLRNLRKRGVAFNALEPSRARRQILDAFREHAGSMQEPYAHWYVDGGDGWEDAQRQLPGAVSISYVALAPLRKQVLARMEAVRTSGSAGAEAMRDRLSALSAKDVNAEAITSDPVLQRFYTELFTQGSGTQIFSTTFVQWAGRELARRARPKTLLLRYTPRQSYRAFDELLQRPDPTALDPEGSLRDAEMSAWYNWIEMDRITAPGQGTFMVWREDTAQGVMVAHNAPADTLCTTPMTIEKALKTFS